MGLKGKETDRSPGGIGNYLEEGRSKKDRTMGPERQYHPTWSTHREELSKLFSGSLK